MINPNSPIASSNQDSSPGSSAVTGMVAGEVDEKKGHKRLKPARRVGLGESDSTASPRRLTSCGRRSESSTFGDKIAPPCSECGRRFGSWKALFGHMRCHPERQWRGINPPPDSCRMVAVEEEQQAVFAASCFSLFGAKLRKEEHEAAECLIILANGVKGPDMPQEWAAAPADSTEEVPMQTVVAAAEAASTSACRFECSCCKRVFGSHQALGGHRASHKNVKGCFARASHEVGEHEQDIRNSGEERSMAATVADIDKGKAPANVDEDDKEVIGMAAGHHQCGQCFKNFPSGQALGGHKRCHWEKGDEQALPSSTTKPYHSLDLNLAPPAEDQDPSSELILDLRLGF